LLPKTPKPQSLCISNYSAHLLLGFFLARPMYLLDGFSASSRLGSFLVISSMS